MRLLDCHDANDLLEGFQRALAGEDAVVLVSPRQRGLRGEFADSVVQGLSHAPRHLDCRFLYDARGSALFEQITAQPEYYVTRTEAAILERCAEDICALTGPAALVELGSGSSKKTVPLLRALCANQDRVCYVPVDVSTETLVQASHDIRARVPDVQVVGINGTFDDALPLLTHAAPTLTLFLGSTLGNLDPAREDDFWRKAARGLCAGDHFLLGVDLVKGRELLEAAYNDAAGVTAQFTLNLFVRMNRELGAGLRVNEIQHIARWNAQREQIEIVGRFSTPQVVRLPRKDRCSSISIAAGEEIRVEISRKYRLQALLPRLRSLGFATVRVFTDPREWFAVILLRREGTA